MRECSALATDVTAGPALVRGDPPGLSFAQGRGELRGQFQSHGTLAQLAVDASLAGQIGTIDAHGFATLRPPDWGAEDLLLRFSSLDLAALTGRTVPTSLEGELWVSGRVDTLQAPEGELRLALVEKPDPRVHPRQCLHRRGLHDSVIRLDTAYAVWKGARVGGSGTLGWTGPHGGQMAFTLAADSLIAFDSLLLAATGQTRDNSPDSRPLGGTAHGSVQLARQPRHPGDERRPADPESRVAAHQLSPGDRRVQLDRRAAAPTDRLGWLRLHGGPEVGIP